MDSRLSTSVASLVSCSTRCKEHLLLLLQLLCAQPTVLHACRLALPVLARKDKREPNVCLSPVLTFC